LSFILNRRDEGNPTYIYFKNGDGVMDKEEFKKMRAERMK